MFPLQSTKIPLLCFILLLFFILNSALLHSSNETDYQALLAFKNSITEDPLNALSSWNTSLHFCQWEGITCGTRHLRVNALSLPSRRLRGTLSPHIGNLSFIRIIELTENNFHGEVPIDIGRLTRMTKLSLSNNSLQGDFPNNLSRCSNLTFINLGSNRLEGEIPLEIGSLFKLSVLGLNSNRFTGKIPSSLGNLSSLQKLSLAQNNLEGNIPVELGQLLKLDFLQLSDNGLSGSIPTPFYNLSSLKVFSLAYNDLTGSFPQDFGSTLQNMQGLFLGLNRFYGLIPTSIANASGLVQFDITKNSFTGPLPKNFGSLLSLQRVALGSNSLRGNLDEFIHSLSNCSKLETLQLGSNHFRSKFPHSIANLSTKLTWLDLGNTSLTGSIPLEIGTLNNLRILGINSNMLTGNIPHSIGSLSKLVKIYFYGNEISGEIPSSIGNLTKLNLLVGMNNMLEGTLPSSLGNCTNLLGINLGWNKLSSPIPERLFDIFSLSYGLVLNNNIFTGTLPVQVGNLKNLQSLDVSKNKLSGTIPTTLGSCVMLESLNMQGNSFSGSIPKSFAQMKAIRVLDLSDNHLSGSIPMFLIDKTYENLNLSYNSFDGEVPTRGVFQNMSAFSVVGNNKLCGGIKELKFPSCPLKPLERRRKKTLNLRILVPIATILPVIFLILLISAIVYFIRRSKRAMSSISTLHEKYPKLSYAELSVATSGFSSSNLVGEGRYGSVYRGILSVSNEIIAVKVLNLQQHGANKSFLAECEALRSIRHRNLIKIITSCSSLDFKGQDFKALVFEFMPNGSLEDWLHPNLSQETRSLSVLQRLDIAIGVASALDYLHHHCEPAIVHCDIKPSNILLDNDLHARVSDFGLAKILTVVSGMHNNESSTILIRGTIGYVAPEYAMSFEVSKEGDMYSYGVLLLEMFTGKRPTSSLPDDITSLHDYVRKYLQNQVLEIVDPQIILEVEDERLRSGNTMSTTNSCIQSILEIGVFCSTEQARERMDSKVVLVELHKIRNAYFS